MADSTHLQDIKALEETVKSLKEALEKQEKTNEEFRRHSQNKPLEDLSIQVTALIATKIEESVQRNNPSGYFFTGLPTIEFPKFSGDGFDEWLYKCNEFFELCKTPDEIKVRLASFHMEGKVLQWHKAVMEERKLSSVLKWKEYTDEMRLKSRDKIHGSGMRNVPGKTDTTSLSETKWPIRRICMLKKIGDREIPQPKESHQRFGPFYCNDQSSEVDYKEEAWQHLLKNSPDRVAVTTEIYLLAMRKIEEETRATYDDGVVDQFSRTEFRWMMIKDGCFFLQLALYILGGAQQLGYPRGHKIFFFKKIKYNGIKEWIEVMFLVGNQIPLVVLKELMKQSFFQTVIENGKWEKPSDLCRTALYELLLLPAQETLHSIPLRKWLSRKVFASRAYWLQQQKPSDLLHGLQLLVLGPKSEEEEEVEKEEEDEGEKEEEEEKDLEGQQELSNSGDVAIDNKTSHFSATELRKNGIHFRPLCSGKGSRGIQFTDRKWRFKLFPILYLPRFLVGDDTELMFQCLRNYEISQTPDIRKHEVSSYLLFMSELICTADDAKLIGNKEIIQGNHHKHKFKLPGILKRLAPKESRNQNLRRLKLQSRDYSPPKWTEYWHIVSIALAVTILQTIYTILPYYKS